MRLDYALYGLAVVLFAFAAFAFAYVANAYIGIIYAVVTIIVGLLSVVGGYALRPKVDGVSLVQTSTSKPVEESSQQILAPVAKNPVIEAQVAEESQPESPSMGISSLQGSSVEQPQKVEAFNAGAPGPGHAEAPVSLTQGPTVEVPHSAPAPEEVASPAAKLILTQLRGINEKRAEQLKANGVTTMEDLAKADPDDLAQKLDVSVKIVKMWIGSAKKLAK